MSGDSLVLAALVIMALEGVLAVALYYLGKAVGRLKEQDSLMHRIKLVENNQSKAERQLERVEEAAETLCGGSK